jgi:hypothetical protein
MVTSEFNPERAPRELLALRNIREGLMRLDTILEKYKKDGIDPALPKLNWNRAIEEMFRDAFAKPVDDSVIDLIDIPDEDFSTLVRQVLSLVNIEITSLEVPTAENYQSVRFAWEQVKQRFQLAPYAIKDYSTRIAALMAEEEGNSLVLDFLAPKDVVDHYLGIKRLAVIPTGRPNDPLIVPSTIQNPNR